MEQMQFERQDLKKIADFIDQAHLVLTEDAVMEIYHHRGVENFKNIGAVFIKIINCEYCKSYVIMLPGQTYPNHFHKIKTETFFVLLGQLDVTCEGEVHSLHPGEILSVERGQSHSFSSINGAVFEELSTTYIKNDSVYSDSIIRNSVYEQRKTLIPIGKFKEMIVDE